GRLIGGNLELVSRLCGTAWLPPLDEAVLVLEEVGERPYRIDRALTQLRLSGALASIRAVVLVELLRFADSDQSMPAAESVVLERLGPLGVPIVAGAPVGHGELNRPLPHGAEVEVDATSGTMTFLEGAVS